MSLRRRAAQATGEALSAAGAIAHAAEEDTQRERAAREVARLPFAMASALDPGAQPWRYRTARTLCADIRGDPSYRRA